MLDKEIKLVIGGLLHDVGKIVYRTGDTRKHSQSGYETIKESAADIDTEILDQIRYHHADALSNAKLANDSLAYITYIADNISSGMDRRKASEDNCGFNKNIGLGSIFNIINDNEENQVYKPLMLNTEGEINYPQIEPVVYDKKFYEDVIRNILDNLKGINITYEYINSLLEIMEANTSFVPSSTNMSELTDISLYDHVKLTAALGSTIYYYLEENNIVDYKEVLYKNSKAFYDEKAFRLYSLDLSGIQSFIYTVASDGALKTLRSRSFYLEILMEHLVDQLLGKTGLSRTNLLYSGGGHAYILLANTKAHEKAIKEFSDEVNQWFLDNYGIELYMAYGSSVCSAHDLGYISDNSTNNPEYKEVFSRISKEISRRKLTRYTASDIIRMNSTINKETERECKVCHRTDKLTEDDKCEVCSNIEKMSNSILNESFFSIVDRKPMNKPYLILPYDCYMIADSKESLSKRMVEDSSYIRAYGKNKFYTGDRVATKLWVGDYINGRSFEELAKTAKGIKRIAVLRADIDNLGKTFVSGFESKKNNDKYVGLSRTSTFSRKMSIFFKNHINNILKNGEFYLGEVPEDRKRNALIVYAGGDDVFVIGSWDDIIGFAIDLKKRFEAFAQGMLTLSAGIGLYPEKYPVVAMANQTGELEEIAKGYKENNNHVKNAITLFSDDFTFAWDDFINIVIGKNYEIIKDYFSNPLSNGKTFIYRLLEFLRDNNEDRINLSRLAYNLTRMEPRIKEDEDKEKVLLVKQQYNEFKTLIYEAMKNKVNLQKVIAALMLYVYLTRSEKEE